MKIQIMHSGGKHEIQLEQITQLCGIGFQKKRYIVQSLCKYFSGSKYAPYELQMQDNIQIEEKTVGRKYFSILHISSRENLISAIKITKSSLMMQYLLGRYNEYSCQGIMNQIAEDVERLYLELNKGLQGGMREIEIGYGEKSLLEIIQSSEIFALGEKPLESLSNAELLGIYIDLLWEIQRKSPQKYLLIIENADHLLCYSEYQKFIEKIERFCAEFDVWFLLLMSIEGFVVVNEHILEGINVINDCIFSFPEMEQVMKFIQDHYPCYVGIESEKICEELRMIVHNIGNEEYSIHLQSSVLLKMFQKTLCINIKAESGMNSLEKAFVMGKNVL